MPSHDPGRTYRNLLLGDHIPHDEFRTVPGFLGGGTGEQYGDVVSSLLDLARKLLRLYVHVQVDVRRERLTNSAKACW